jgi:hypothetical protein
VPLDPLLGLSGTWVPETVLRWSNVHANQRFPSAERDSTPALSQLVRPRMESNLAWTGCSLWLDKPLIRSSGSLTRRPSWMHTMLLRVPPLVPARR